ncbi:MAG: hypothetical protein ACYC4U_28445 [Pirellulaceae bacterium]
MDTKLQRVTCHSAWSRRGIAAAVTWCGALLAAVHLAGAAETSAYVGLASPVRLQADGKVIDTGDAWGHAGPCIEDIDGDGLHDLIVGDFSGQFRFYRNAGTNEQPVYESRGYLQAGGEAAKVPIY